MMNFFSLRVLIFKNTILKLLLMTYHVWDLLLNIWEGEVSGV